MSRSIRLLTAMAALLVILVLTWKAAPLILRLTIMKDNVCIYKNGNLSISSARNKSEPPIYYFSIMSVGSGTRFYDSIQHISIRIDDQYTLHLHDVDMTILESIASIKEGGYINPTVWPDGTIEYVHKRSVFTIHENRLLSAVLYPTDWQEFEFSMDQSEHWIQLPQRLTPDEAEELFGNDVWTFYMQ